VYARPFCGFPRRCTATETTASWRPWSASPARRGVSGYIGDGSNRWPAVHRLDAAHLFRLGLEQAPAGSTLHAVVDEGVPIRAIAEIIGRQLDLPVAAMSPEDAAGHFGWLAGYLAVDSPASSALTRQLLGWQPTHPGLIDDLDKGHYFPHRCE
jgi:nucleoside-diphosphate-sugar epimerase